MNGESKNKDSRCQAITIAGNQCNRLAKNQGYCNQHFLLQKKNSNNEGNTFTSFIFSLFRRNHLIWWVIGGYASLYTIALAKYELSTSILEIRANSFFSLIGSNQPKAAIELMPTMQNELIPYEPDIINPLSTLKTFFVKTKHSKLSKSIADTAIAVSRSINLNSTNETSTLFENVNIPFSDFSHSDIGGTNFKRSNLSYSSFYLSNSQVVAKNSNFNNTKWNGGKFEILSFGYSDITNSDFSNSEIHNFDYSHIYKQSDFDKFIPSKRNSILSFTNVNLQNVRFDFIDISGAFILNSNFSGITKLSGYYSGITIKNSDLTDSIFSHSQFSESSFENVKLMGIDFNNTNLTNSEFINVDIESSRFDNSDLSNSKFINSTIGSFNTAVITGYDGPRLIFEDTFKNTNLMNVLFDNSWFSLKDGKFHHANSRCSNFFIYDGDTSIKHSKIKNSIVEFKYGRNVIIDNVDFSGSIILGNLKLSSGLDVDSLLKAKKIYAKLPPPIITEINLINPDILEEVTDKSLLKDIAFKFIDNAPCTHPKNPYWKHRLIFADMSIRENNQGYLEQDNSILYPKNYPKSN